MTTIAEITKKLEKYKSPFPDKWKNEANIRICQRQELRNTQTLAIKIIEMMDKTKISKTELAKKLNIDNEYLENILHCQIFMTDSEKKNFRKETDYRHTINIYDYGNSDKKHQRRPANRRHRQNQQTCTREKNERQQVYFQFDKKRIKD